MPRTDTSKHEAKEEAMLAEQVSAVVQDNSLLERLMFLMIGIQILIGIALAMAHSRITRNQVEMAEYVKQAVDRIESKLADK